MDAEINLTPTASLLEIEPLAQSKSAEADRQPISARTWGLASDCTAGVLLVHGLGAHSGWFEAFGRRLKVNRFFVLAYDQLGFGKRQHEKFLSYEQWLDDLAAVFDYQRSLIGDKPLYICANSMGATITLKAVSSQLVDPSGIALFSPALEANRKTFKLGFRARTLFQAWTSPDTDVVLPYNVDLITRQETVRAWLRKDPLMRLKVPARMLWELLKMTRDLPSQCSTGLGCPVIMYSAGVDHLIDKGTNNYFFDHLTAKKKHRIYEEAWHDLMFDPVLNTVAQDLTAWIKENALDLQRIASSS